MFEQVQAAPPDPILGLTEAFNEDPNPQKINLGVGVYKDETGITPVFRAVREAERRLAEAGQSKSYLPMTGLAAYDQEVQRLLFGADSALLEAGRAVTAQAPGGTGALRVAGDFIRRLRPETALWVSQPTWANHKGIFGAAGLEVKDYPYYDAENRSLDLEALLEGLAAIPEGDAVLLHGCCHNPTGVDPDLEAWGRIATVLAERRLLPVIDLAYQGFASGIEQDAAGLRRVCEAVPEALIASSYSKNFGLYCERTGALTLVAADAERAAVAAGHLKLAIRTNYSNPPAHGARLVAAILTDADLRADWQTEVGEIRDRIRKMREAFVEGLAERGVQRDFSFLTRQNGMFSFSGLTPEQVGRLREEYAIYIVNSGRINVAGMTSTNLPRLCEAIAAVL